MKECITCKDLFEETRKWQKYCGKRCRDRGTVRRESTRDFQKRRRDKLTIIKLEAGCSNCGYNAHPSALDFNHVRGVKLFNISQDPKRAWDVILSEIAKCEVLCANCHRIHTYENQHWQKKRGDRCD